MNNISKELQVSNDYFIEKIEKNEPIVLEKEYKQLIKVLNFHNELYYQKSSPIITDYQYDMLFKMLEEYERKYPQDVSTDSPTKSLTNQIQKGFEKATNKIPLLSLENSYSEEEVVKWLNTLKKEVAEKSFENNLDINFSIEPKFDGLSIALTYEYGYLTKAITRGNGKIGENVLNNVKQIMNIPQYVSNFLGYKEIILRGEIVMSKSVFNELNKGLAKPFSNPRNAASGSLKQLDASKTRERKLECYIYDIMLFNIDNDNQLTEEEYRLITIDNLLKIGLKTQEDILKFLDFSGFGIFSLSGNKKAFIGNQKEIVEMVKPEQQQKMDLLDIEFDGLVIKLNQIKYRHLLGETGHHVKWGIAYKFPAKQFITKLLSVSYQVGRTGIITPVANLQTIDIDGVKVSRASLHNFSDIELKDIRLNDYVIVQRSGEVIPYIIGSVIEKRGNDTSKIIAPDKCPICNGSVKKIQGLIGHYCTNKNCKGKKEGKIIFFVSKGGLDIKGFGEETAKKFINEGFINTISDVFKIERYKDKIIRLEGFGIKKYNLLIKGIEKAKNSELWKVIESLGLPLVGGNAGKIIEEIIVNDYLQNNKELENFNVDDLLYYFKQSDLLENIDGFGEKIVLSLYSSANDNSIINEMKELEKLGLLFNNFNRILKKKKIQKSMLNNSTTNKKNDGNGKFGTVGTTFSITGSFDISRPKIVELLEDRGYIFHKSPKKDTQIMIIGEKAGSKKEKAEKMGIKIITNYKELL